jgi:hypothetical protein
LTPRHPPCALVSFFHVKSAKLKYTFYSVLKVLAPLAFTASPWPTLSDRGQRSTGKQKGSVHQPSPTTWQIPFSRVFSSSIRLPAYSPSTGPSKRRSWWSGGDSNPGCSSVQRRCHPTRRPPLARPLVANCAMVGLSGLEPETFPIHRDALHLLRHKGRLRYGGPFWTRTRDPSLIRTVL